MELIPILSLIILVATLCTFILAIGAFYYYKRKEKKRKAQQMQQPDFIQAELVTPGPYVPGRSGIGSEYAGGYERKIPAYYETRYVRPASAYRRKRAGHKFMRYTASGFLEPLTDRIDAERVKWR